MTKTIRGQDMDTVGHPNFFSLEAYLQVVEMVICCDEIEKAMWMLDNPPTYYRNHHKIVTMRKELLRQIETAIDYSKQQGEADKQKAMATIDNIFDTDFLYPRWYLIKSWAEKQNYEGKTPHIVELGPAQFWLPYGLKKHSIKATYEAHSINQQSIQWAKEEFKDLWDESKKPTAFFCLEVIEHLKNPEDIFHFYCKLKSEPELVVISTPCHTLYGGLDNWRARDLGHLRAYAPEDLLAFCRQHWPDRNWTFMKEHMMVAWGELTAGN